MATQARTTGELEYGGGTSAGRMRLPAGSRVLASPADNIPGVPGRRFWIRRDPNTPAGWTDELAEYAEDVGVLAEAGDLDMTAQD